MALDFPRYAGQVVILATIESNLGVINVCLPVMQPVLSNFTTKFKSLLSSIGSDSGSSSGSSPPLFMPQDHRTKGSLRNTKFDRLDDAFCSETFGMATEISHERTLNDVESGSERVVSENTDIEMDDNGQMERRHGEEPAQCNGIKVTTGWSITR